MVRPEISRARQYVALRHPHLLGTATLEEQIIGRVVWGQPVSEG